ncbi:MAG: HEPN domain-containing protein, partial [Phycisphaerae bacterium]|nr:HEPN domain-containing protein [Phycisphaerae bacterium]
VAKELLNNGHYRDAANRAYYAMFYCGLGLLAAKNLGTSKHTGVLSLFSRNFVKTGDISKDAGRHLREAFELRQRCDYREFVVIESSQAEEVIANAGDFITEAKSFMDRLA